MQSEIPQLQVITAISDADSEDFVAQLLFSQGWSIIFRAFEFEALENFMASRGQGLRTVIIYKSDLPGYQSETFRNLSTATTTIICVDGVPGNSHELMTHIRSQLRLPLIIANQGASSSITDPGKIQSQILIQQVTITGTTGAPGRSNISVNLANYLASVAKVRLIDADLRAPSVEYLVGRSQGTNQSLELIFLDQEVKPVLLPAQDSSKILITDLGALPPLEEVVNDRRWQAGLINQILEQTTTLIYVCKSSGLSLIRLESFMAQFPILLRKIPIIYLLNQSGSTREDRALERRFKSMVQAEAHFVLPKDPRSTTSFSAPTKRGSTFTKEIGKIASVIQSGH